MTWFLDDGFIAGWSRTTIFSCRAELNYKARIIYVFILEYIYILKTLWSEDHKSLRRNSITRHYETIEMLSSSHLLVLFFFHVLLFAISFQYWPLSRPYIMIVILTEKNLSTLYCYAELSLLMWFFFFLINIPASWRLYNDYLNGIKLRTSKFFYFFYSHKI